MAVVVAVVASVLLLKVMEAPDCACPPTVEAKGRATLMPFAVIEPPMFEAFSPMAPAGVAMTLLPGDTVHAVPLTTAGLGQI
ncbi:hypothetical protein ASE66_30710 [Bosea sp. Root483D1]|nr:hypothetical protein ASE66_30710 [Bosea sp. Root483D1]